MKSADIRRAFLEYFRSQGHEIVSSSSLVPQNDPTLLFSNAGMNQFKDLFLGAEQRAYRRATTAQKCLRISGKHNDLENVGVSSRHHTFFEMMGNFSFGDYFKAEAISYAWEFVSKVLQLDVARLWVTIFENDDEAEKLWQQHGALRPGRIVRMGEKDNFWAMGDTGPCGPCSEIHYYVGPDIESQSAAAFLKDDGTYWEFWNLVFMQFDRQTDGTLAPLPKPAVDTGLGLERMAAILQGKAANYDTDLLRGLITVVEELSGSKYDGSDYTPRDLRQDAAYARDVAMRVIADHARAAAFLIADGVQPGSDGRGYVLRRLIRRALRHGRVLEFKEPFLAQVTAEVGCSMGAQYPELVDRGALIKRLVAAEELKFYETLDAGLGILQKAVEKLDSGELFPGESAFLLHDTYGFPLDLTQDALKAYQREVDVAAFAKAMARQKARSREDRKSQGLIFSSVKVTAAPTEFLGYATLTAESRLTQIIPAGAEQERYQSGDSVSLIFAATPFYAEAGGQVGDSGTIALGEAKLRVEDTQKLQNDFYAHHCTVAAGELCAADLGKVAQLSVDETRRNRIRAHHSATHLLHAALRRVLGEHVRQSGSRVDEQSLRFDYSHFEPVKEGELAEIQGLVNEQIRANHEVLVREMGLDEAKQLGALAFFGDKYGDRVRVVSMGSFTLEFCGGTHVGRSGDIGLLLALSDTGISAGVRRIECAAGASAFAVLQRERQERELIAALLKSDSADLPGKVEKLVARCRSLEKECEALKNKVAGAASGELLNQVRTSPQGIKVIAEVVAGADTNTLRSTVDRLRLKLGSGVVALGTAADGQATIVAGVTPDLTQQVSAGRLVQQTAQAFGGRGGGRPDFAQAGGVAADRLSAALDHLYRLVE